MPRKLFLSLYLLIFLLAGCGRDDPRAQLDAAVKQLQDNLEAKSSGAVMEQLHADFRANGEFDRDWARRTMTLMFLRHQQVKVIILSSDSQLDPASPSRGRTDAQVALTGAENLIPDSAGHYSVKLEWWRDGSEWKLARLDWQ
ncbi:hypothetical protein JVX91_02705 [Pseudomonas sp. PDNC002]|uniref:hypothetical protein n=1 Tax=Pseudomonas sp. PDNC002 TaxID=2811422 RepID=UPI0019630387|nr:hypothetical protein [Pseudomonas sp. PDNC002]QRY80048.1 hypothetical protein JVX91_02705 [Pseudomonas sp. PDNC002]